METWYKKLSESYEKKMAGVSKSMDRFDQAVRMIQLLHMQTDMQLLRLQDRHCTLQLIFLNTENPI